MEVEPSPEGSRRSMVADLSDFTVSDESPQPRDSVSMSSGSPMRADIMSIMSLPPNMSTDSLPRKGWRGSPKRFLERVKSRKSWSPRKSVGSSPGKECHTPNSVE